MSPLATVELPAGVRHNTTTAVAETWAAWDALSTEDGWTYREWPVEDPHGVHPDGIHRQKEAVIREHRIVVFPPHTARQAVAA